MSFKKKLQTDTGMHLVRVVIATNCTTEPRNLINSITSIVLSGLALPLKGTWFEFSFLKKEF